MLSLLATAAVGLHMLPTRTSSSVHGGRRARVHLCDDLQRIMAELDDDDDEGDDVR
jgi:hypothetical protein